MENIPQTWFEMPEIRRRFFEKSTWVPLKEASYLLKEGEVGHFGYKEEYFGVHSLAIPLSQKSEGEKLEWDEIIMGNPSTGYVKGEEYVPANIYKNYEGLTAERLVIEMRGNALECPEWHLSQDLTITLGLKREDDTWLAISRGYEEVVKMERDKDGCPKSIVIKASYLKDYLCARKMALYMTLTDPECK